MNLTDEQKVKVKSWIETGMKLAEIQTKLENEFGLRVTYMEVRFLVDDLKVLPKDPEPPKTPEPTKAPAAEVQPDEQQQDMDDEPEMAEEEQLPGGGNVKLELDTVAVPGTMVSGKVTFSDGQVAQWYLDQMGRLGLAPKQKGYRPQPQDVQAFQMELEKVLRKFGG